MCHALLLRRQVGSLDFFVQQKKQAFAVLQGELLRLSQVLNVRITVAIRPSLQGLNLRCEHRYAGQQFIETALCGGQRGVRSGLHHQGRQ